MSCIRSVSPSEVYQYLSEHKLVGVAVAVGVAAFILGGLAYGNIGGSIGKCLSNLPYKWTLIAGGGLWLALTWILSPSQKGDPALAEVVKKAPTKSTVEHDPIKLEAPEKAAHEEAMEGVNVVMTAKNPLNDGFVDSDPEDGDEGIISHTTVPAVAGATIPGAYGPVPVDVFALHAVTGPSIAAMKAAANSGGNGNVDPDAVVFSLGERQPEIPRWKYV